jgi:hypothetical protein
MDRLAMPHGAFVQSDSAKAVGVCDWPRLDMQAVNDKTRQQALPAGRRFGRMTCGRCVALHPSLYPEALPWLDIGGRTASSDPSSQRWRTSKRPTKNRKSQDRELRETAVLHLQLSEPQKKTVIRGVHRLSSGPVTGGSCSVT